MRVLFLLAATLTLGLIVVVSSWSLLARRASRVGPLEERIDSLLAEQGRVQALARRIEEVEARYNHLRLLFGSVEEPVPGIWTELPEDPPGSRPMLATSTTPTLWPLTVGGFLTQGLLEDTGEAHPGIDIAVPTDSYVRASGGGTIIDAAEDPVYGQFVLIDHGEGLRTLYGHASLLLVERGQVVRQGEVIALSGSSGRSTAPHLHFEILLEGKPIDPFQYVERP